MNNNKNKSRLIKLLIPLILLLIFTNGCDNPPKNNLKKTTFKKLDKIRKEKKGEVLNYFNDISEKAKNTAKDKQVIAFFDTVQKQYEAGIFGKGIPLDYNLEMKMVELYAYKYNDFYDMLFVDNNGFVFYSVKNEADYHTNLFSGKFSNSSLAKHIKEKQDYFFVDYSYYLPSDEAAAFFVVPVIKNRHLQGRIIMQCAINKVNTILNDHEYLGRTGEVYLVNKDKLMLTDSNFIEDSTILRLKVDTNAVKLAILNKSKNMIIKDYRNTTVFSSFEQFDFFGASWVIIVEIDESEVITNHFKDYEAYYLNKIVNHIAHFLPKKRPLLPQSDKTCKIVEVNEYAKLKPNQTLKAIGVNPCTALTILYPEKYGYLVHISPTDKTYNNGLIENLQQSSKTNMVDKLVKKIIHYSTHPYELENLEFIIVAKHIYSLKNLIDTLIDNNINLSQIKYISNPKADYANVTLNNPESNITIRWRGEKIKPDTYVEYSSDSEDLSSIVKKILGYDKE